MEQPTEILVMSVEEAGRLLGLGRSAAYDAVHRGAIPVVRNGRSLMVPKAAFQRMLEGAQAPQVAA